MLMHEQFVTQITSSMAQAAELYHRLVVLVAPLGAGKTATLQHVHEHMHIPLVNVNLDLAARMLDLTTRQRSLQLPRLMNEIVRAKAGDAVLLDNIELLFDVTLMQDPLRLLQGLSRNRTVVVAWSGSVAEGHLTYASPDHPEYRRYACDGLLLVGPSVPI
ncbi:MAG: BREX-3 system P-loop-containing protein BrxF [Anaerolineae bacterium]